MSPGVTSGRYCRSCGARLARDNRALLCATCMSVEASPIGPPEVPESFWTDELMIEALETWHIGRVLWAFRNHPFHGTPISQAMAAGWVDMTQPQISKLETGPPVKDLDKLTFWARTLRVPPSLLWFRLPAETPSGPDGDGRSTDRPPLGESVDNWPGSTALPDGLNASGLPATSEEAVARSGPALTLDELDHIAAALGDARYLDRTAVRYFRRQLALCATDDGQAGPRHALPRVLGILAAVNRHARSVGPSIRGQLLGVGARAAEFAGWLYRDVGDPKLAAHWRDRAFEWAAEAGDLPMCGYILLKKSQAAWDERDAVRMLSLAQAAQRPTWHVPRRVHAEAAQQEARGHAMIGGDIASVDRKLDEAREALGTVEDEPPAPEDLLPLGAHYDEALLTMQTAICYSEAGRAASAVALYRGWLSENRFSRRDYGYFLSLMANTLAKADDIQEAARTGLHAHALAAETRSIRTLGELRQLATALSHWDTVPDVRDLQEAVLAG